jgi:hypothetical protein
MEHDDDVFDFSPLTASSAVTTTFAFESLIRAAMASGEKPAKITV